MKHYEDLAFCHNCHKDTLHFVVDSEHERDSSGDYRECKECGWHYSGYTNKYEPPHKEVLNGEPA